MLINDWLAAYQPATTEDYKQALREIMQQITLAGLSRAGFFTKAAFYGGTALRIFYALPRFSEDLDFSLLKKNENFQWQDYLPAIEEEFLSHGMQVNIKVKEKTANSAVESAFLKPETLWSELVLDTVVPQISLQQKIGIKIKIEIDTHPPVGFETEEKLLLQPYSFYVKVFKIEDLFAGKMHALLFRKWNKNVKGRDWYDMEWYIRKGVAMNLTHFAIRAQESDDWQKPTLTIADFMELLKNRIETVDLSIAKRDVSRFLENPNTLDIWSKPYFLDLIEHIKINT